MKNRTKARVFTFYLVLYIEIKKGKTKTMVVKSCNYLGTTIKYNGQIQKISKEKGIVKRLYNTANSTFFFGKRTFRKKSRTRKS